VTTPTTALTTPAGRPPRCLARCLTTLRNALGGARPLQYAIFGVSVKGKPDVASPKRGLPY
jgi:hypothetical protein